MSNNKQSSVEWYSKEIGKITALALNGKMTGLEWKYLQGKALEQAKAMHKEEIIEARIDGDTWSTAIKEMRRNYAELYYNETFNNEQTN